MNIYKKIAFLLNAKQRKMIFVLFMLMLVGMVFETLGIALILPILAVITQKDFIDSYPIVGEFANFFVDNPTQEQIVIGGIIVMVGVYIIKTIFMLFLTWVQDKFTAGLTVSISKLFFSGYMHQPYTFHIQRNSAELIRNIRDEVFGFIGAMSSAMILLSEILIISGIAILLFVVDPGATMTILGVFFLFVSVFYFSTRLHILNWGRIRQYHNGKTIQQLQQGLNGVKDIKLLGREATFIDEYLYHMQERARVGILFGFIQAIPRYTIELLMIIVISIVVFIMINRGQDVELIVPLLGVFAMAAFRIMPSINRIIGNVQNLRFSLPTIEKLHEEYKLFIVDLENKNESFLDFQKEIKVDNISYSYPGVAIANLSNISFSIPVGKSIGFIGGSGAGKTTLIDIILGLLSPSQGSILVDGKDIALNMRAWQKTIGYIPQDIYLTDDTLRNNIAFGLRKDEINELWVRDALIKVELKEFIDSLPDGLDTMVGEHGVRLSGGQRQRIGIARALYHKPNVLVMDESTSSLDNTTESKVMQSINTLHGEKTIIIIAHRLSTIKYCDYIYKLENGKIIKEGDYKSIIQEED